MRILHLSTFDRAGGAAIAAHRLHAGLRLRGHESSVLVRDRAARTDHVEGFDVTTPLTGPVVHLALHTIYRDHRNHGVDTLFSPDLPTHQLAEHPFVRSADVINVHWVSGFLSAAALGQLQCLGKPVVWTLHDQAAFTGGCHYSGDCTGYTTGCTACPMMAPAASFVPQALLRHKQQWIDGPALTVVCPSEWLSACARASALLGRAAIQTVANSLPVATFQQPSRAAARMQLSLPEHAAIVLIGSDHLDERRKGHAHAIDALSLLATSPAMQERLNRREIICVAFGDGDLQAGSLPIVRLGRLEGDERMALAYRAADLFLLPSLEDNLPNTLLEATAAGTPVVAYATGGIPDIVSRAGCGLLAQRGDVAALGNALAFLLDDGSARRRMGELGEAYARRHLDLGIQADAYLQIYERVLHRSTAATRVNTAAETSDTSDFRARVAATECGLLDTVLGSPELGRLLLASLARDAASHQELIASRGGEIEALRQALTLANEELARVHDEWRQTRETLHQTSKDLESAASLLARERTDHATTLGIRSAERAALKRKLRNQMTAVVIAAAGDTGRRVWEALAHCGAAHAVAFVQRTPLSRDGALLGLGVHGFDWLRQGDWDLIVVPDGPDDVSLDLIAAGIDPSRIVMAPASQGDEVLAATLKERFPDPFGQALVERPAAAGVRLGIFGTGSAAMKVWEAIAEIDQATAVWFADNNPNRQGSTFLWLDIIAPDRIPERTFDAIVIGSMSRDPIRQQLTALGVAADRILTPDVLATPAQIGKELNEWLRTRRAQEVAS